MNARRFEHPTAHRFWEVYWEGDAAEILTGRIGTSGRASQLAAGAIADEIAKKLREGFVEVVPDLVKDRVAPSAEPPAALMQRVLEAPDDDQARMVLADWWQQQGDPRGELIAVQLEAAQTPPGKTVPKRLRDREEHLLATFRTRWLPDATGADVTFVRGFADRVKLEMPIDVSLLVRVLAASPLLRTLVVAPPRGQWQRIWTVIPHQLLQKFSGIFMSGVGCEDEHFAAFAAIELPRLDRLGMRSMTMLPSSWKRLAGRTWRELDLHHNSLGKRGVEYLVARERSTLEALDLGSNEIGDEGLKLLASIPMPALRTLSLRRSKLTPKCLPSLERFTQLRTLDISHNNLDDAYVREVLPGVKLAGKKAS